MLYFPILLRELSQQESQPFSPLKGEIRLQVVFGAVHFMVLLIAC